jgi:hypothetical protein
MDAFVAFAQIVPALLFIGFIVDVDIVALPEDWSQLLIVHDCKAFAALLEVEGLDLSAFDGKQKGLATLVLRVIEVDVLAPSAGSEASENMIGGGIGQENSICLVVAGFMEGTGFELMLRCSKGRLDVADCPICLFGDDAEKFGAEII